MGRTRVYRVCSYCGEAILKTETHEHEKVDGIIAYYHLECWYAAGHEHQLLRQLRREVAHGRV